MVYKYIKNRIIVFVSLVALIVCLVYVPSKFEKTEAKDDETISTCWLACFIDDTNYSYKTQVIYSGEQLEGTRIARFLPWANEDGDKNFGRELGKDKYPDFYAGRQSALLLDNVNDRVPIMGLKNEDTGLIINPNSGYINIDLSQGFSYAGMYINNISMVDFSNFEGFHTPRPLSFPTMKNSANASDINRAYEVQDAIATDFMEALIFVNDGQSFNSVATLQETAYSILTASDDAVLTNQFGNQYVIDFNNGDSTYSAGYPKDDNGYAFYIKIKDTKTGNSEEFCYKVKKGYANCENGDIMENGTINNLRMDSDYDDTDTTYISWEHIYIEAGILYAENISYANQGDLFSMDEAEGLVTKIFRNLLSGLTSSLQLYSIEDCIFNSGVRGSRAFAFGVYYDSWSYFIFLMFLIFMVIAIALVTLSVIRIIIKKLEGTISPSSRYSMVEGIKDLIISLFIICILWVLIKFLLMLNFRFVGIWRDYVAGKSLSDNANNLSSLAGVVYRFIFFIIRIYVNYLYILRGLVVPALIVSSPLFIIAYSFGSTGKKITGQWLRELLGNVFMQSIHAFVYGFILMASISLRGIEAIVICASIIPLTAVFKNVMQIGGDEILKTARGLTAGTATAIGAGVSAGMNAVGGLAEGVGNLGAVISPDSHLANFGAFVGNTAGNLSRASGGIFQASMGAGLNGAMGDNSGSSMISSGLGTVGHSIGDIGRTGFKHLGHTINPPMSSEQRADKDFQNNISNFSENNGLKTSELFNNNGKRQALLSNKDNINNQKFNDMYNNFSRVQNMEDGAVKNSLMDYYKDYYGLTENGFDIKATDKGLVMSERTPDFGRTVSPKENISSGGSVPNENTISLSDMKNSHPTQYSEIQSFCNTKGVDMSNLKYSTNKDGHIITSVGVEDFKDKEEFARTYNNIKNYQNIEIKNDNSKIDNINKAKRSEGFNNVKDNLGIDQSHKVYATDDGRIAMEFNAL